MPTPGERYVAALAAKDTAELVGMFSPDVSFRGLTPGRAWEAGSPDEVVHDVLYQWFEPDDDIVEVRSVETGTVEGLDRVDYSLMVRNPAGLHAVEQRAYLEVGADGRITRMQAMCAGFRRVDDSDD